MIYRNLGDAIIIDPAFFTAGDVEIFYTDTEYFPFFFMNPDETQISKETHIFIGTVSISGTLEENLELIKTKLQAEYWCPNHEALDFANRNHTHMSICLGDIIRQGDKAYFVDLYNFKKISNFDFNHAGFAQA